MTGQTTRLGIRTVVQRLAGAAVLVIGLGGFWYWWAHPLPGGAAMRQAVLAGQAFCLPVGLGQMVFCPSRRDPGEGELEVCNSGWAAPVGAVMELLYAAFLVLLPKLATSAGDLTGLIACGAFLAVGVLAMAIVVVAARNERLLVTPDGHADCWNIWGWYRRAEERPAFVRVRRWLGRYYVCDGSGRVLYHFDKGMIHEKALLDLLQARNVANTGTAVRRRMTEPIPRVQAVEDWNEADRLPAHRWMKWLRPVAWLPPVVLLIQWWLLVQGRNVLGLRSASLLACWLPLIFFGVYLAFPDIFVWEAYPLRPRLGGLRQVLATPAWRRMHVRLWLALLPVSGALMWAVLEARVFLVGRPVPLAVLCLALGVALAVLCERRRPPERRRERGMILMLAAMLAFPLGYSLNLALTAPAVPDAGTVVEVRLPEAEDDDGSLVFRWEGRTFRTPLGGDPAAWPTPGEAIDLRVRQSLLNIPVVSVCRE